MHSIGMFQLGSTVVPYIFMKCEKDMIKGKKPLRFVGLRGFKTDLSQVIALYTCLRFHPLTSGQHISFLNLYNYRDALHIYKDPLNL